ncbi:MAG: hypothetical protein ABJC12_10620 [Saprospiraceae bacterium]
MCCLNQRSTTYILWSGPVSLLDAGAVCGEIRTYGTGRGYQVADISIATDYSRFRKQLFGNITTLNPQYNKLELFKKTQNLMDRFLFLLFAEDRLLLPHNSVRKILKEWDDLRRMDEYRPLYDRFRKYFGWLNTGHG